MGTAIEQHLAMALSGLLEGVDPKSWHVAPPRESGDAGGQAACNDESPLGDPAGAEERRCRALLAEVEAQQRVIAAAQAAQARALAAWVGVLSEPEIVVGAARDGGSGTGSPRSGRLDAHSEALRSALAADAVSVVAEEVTAALRLTPWSADRLVEMASRMAEAMPLTLDALGAGLLDWRRATTITAAAAHLGDDAAAAVDATLCGVGGTGLEAVGKKLTRAIDAAIHAADAQAIARRSRIRTAERGVRTRAVGDGQAEMVVTGPATAVASIGAAIDALGRDSTAASRAGTGTGDPCAVVGADRAGPAHDGRGVDAHRFDALHELLTTTPRQPGSSEPVAPVVLISLSTLLGADDAPAHLSGHGLLPAWLARQAAGDARLRRVLTDPFTGTVIGVDGHTYPPGWLTPPPDDSPGPDSSGPSSPQGPHPGGDSCVRGRGGPQHAGGDACTPRSSPANDAPVASDAPTASSGPAVSTGPAGPGTARRAPEPEPGCTEVDPRECPIARAGGGPYRIPAGLDRLLRARWDTCSAPGCALAAARCDLDHVIAHPAGATCACDLAPLCRRHHRMKHGTSRPTSRRSRAEWRRSAGTRRQRWRVHRCRNGHQHWTSPLGRFCVVAPAAPLTTGSSGERVHLPPLSYLTSGAPLGAPARDAAGPAVTRPGAPVARRTSSEHGDGYGDGYGDLDPDRPPF